jgi:hypothetical protein
MKAQLNQVDAYRETAKQLGVRHLFRRWGISFSSRLPGGRKTWRIRIIPLDGWVTDPEEVARIMRERGMEL